MTEILIFIVSILIFLAIGEVSVVIKRINNQLSLIIEYLYSGKPAEPMIVSYRDGTKQKLDIDKEL